MHREMAYTGGTLYASGGLLVLLAALLSPTEPYAKPLVVGVGATAIAVGAFYVWSAERLPMPLWLYSIATSLGAVLVTLAAYGGGPTTTAVYGMLYVFVSSYGFYYYPWPVASWLVVLDGGGFAIVLAEHDVGGAFPQWLMVVGASVISGGLIGSLGRRGRVLFDIERDNVRELSELDAWKTTFLRAVAHDLRSPLVAIIGGMKTIRDHDERLSPQQRRDLVDRAISGGERLERLVSDLLDMERIEAGNIEPRLEPVALDRLVLDHVATVDPRGRAIEVDATPVTILVEASKVERIVDNLVRNAISHTPDGTHVHVGVEPEGDGAVIVVEDDGPGVDPRIADDLFNAFRSGASNGSSGGGMGLGLHLVRQFAALHGGTVTARNVPGSGARFEVHLPQAPRDGSPQPDGGDD